MRLFRIFALQPIFFVCTFSAAFHATQADERQPQKWAILVGANDYAHLRDLRYASRDMLALGTALISNGFSKDHVFVFHDDAKDPRFKPLKANIERQFGLLMQLVEKGDVLLFGFSGHGLSIGGKTYFCPFEARDDNPSGTMLSVEEIAFKLQNIPASSRLIIADACRNNRRSSDLSGLGRFLESKADGVAVLWSCGPEQASYEEDRFQHGVFIYYMLSGLAGYADGNRDGNVSLAELHHFAHHQTKAHVTQIWNDDQTPHRFGRSDETWTFLRTGTTAAGVRASVSSPTALPVPPKADPAGGPRKWVTNSVGMTLMLIQEGKFVMGSPASEVHRAADELAHMV